MANSVHDVLLIEVALVVPSTPLPLETGAVVDFWGVVRATEAGAEIAGIEYEAHKSMAEHQIRAITDEAARKFELTQTVIHHRIGFVPVGEASLLVRVGSRHRAEAFRGGQWIVDELKKRATIWKHPIASATPRTASASPKRQAPATPAQMPR